MCARLAAADEAGLGAKLEGMHTHFAALWQSRAEPGVSWVALRMLLSQLALLDRK